MTMKIVRNAYGRNAHSHDVLPMLGIPAGGHLPPEGMPAREVQGITVYVQPATPPVMLTGYYGLRVAKSSKHRVMAVCPECGKHVSLGRLQQHAKVHSAWPCNLRGDTTGMNGKPRRINATIDGGGDVKAAIYRFMKRRPRSGEWLGVELRAITPLGQTVRVIYEPNEE